MDADYIVTMSLNETVLEKKFNTISGSQESIQSLSQICLNYRNQHKRIAQIWLKCLQKAKSSHRLTLIYLANDIVQNAKRKHAISFISDFRLIMKDSIPYLKDAKIKSAVERVFNIWRDRNVYDTKFTNELLGALNSSTPTTGQTTATFKIVSEFKHNELLNKLSSLDKFENNTRTKRTFYEEKRQLLEEDETSLIKNKGDTPMSKLISDYDDAIETLQSFIKAQEKERAFRKDLLENLGKAKIYHDAKRAEAKIVHDAYRKYSTKLTAVRTKVQELLKASVNDDRSNSKETSITTFNSDLSIPLPEQKNMLDDKAQPATSLDKRLSELLKTLPSLSQLCTSNQDTNQQSVRQDQNRQQQQQQHHQQHQQQQHQQQHQQPYWYAQGDTNQNSGGYYNPSNYLNAPQQKPPILPPNLSIPPPPMMAMLGYPPPPIVPDPKMQPPISSLISSDQVLSNQSKSTYSHNHSENHEPADMDLSDPEDEHVSGSSNVIPMVAAAMQSGAGGHQNSTSRDRYTNSRAPPQLVASPAISLNRYAYAPHTTLPFDPSIMDHGRDSSSSRSRVVDSKRSSSSGSSHRYNRHHGSSDRKHSSTSGRRR